MPLINPLRLIHASIQPREIKLRNPHNTLNCKQYIRNQSQYRVGRDEMCASVGDFVIFDYYEGGEEGEDGGGV